MSRAPTLSIALVILMAVCMATWPVAMAAPGMAGPADGAVETASEPGVQAEELTDVEIDEIKTQSGEDVTIASELEDEASASDTVEVYVRFDAAASSYAEPHATTNQETLQIEATESQAPMGAFAAETRGLEVTQDFWLDNAMLLEVDTSQVALEELARVDGVTELHPNYEMELIEPSERLEVDRDAEDFDFDPREGMDLPGGADVDHTEPLSDEYTYGLQHVNAPEVWEEFGATGEGVTVAVLDTGIDDDHREFDDYDPDNWAEFSFEGEEIDSTPYDAHGHGTHVSGTVLGGNASGTHIGVAPDAELYAINVFPGVPDGQASTTLAAIVAGMQHAVEEDTDVMNLSLGGSGYAGIYVDVIRNAKESGTHVVSSSGNSGPDSTGTPANVYNGTAVGASDEDRDIASFSTGTEVNTSEDWGFMAPDDWPEEYATPDVSAPGVDVVSAVPGDGYEAWSGTSMASPHVTGMVALMMSAHDELTPSEAKDVMEETANKPPFGQIGGMVLADADVVYDDDFISALLLLSDDDVRDVRYGFGIVDAYAAMATLDEDSATVTGEVLNEDEELVQATLTIDDADRTTDNWQYDPMTFQPEPGPHEFEVVEGEHKITAYPDELGYAPNQTTVSVDAGETVDDADIVLPSILDADPAGQPMEAAADGEFVLGNGVANVENYTIDFAEDSTIDEDNVTFHLVTDAGDDEEIETNETVEISEGATVLEVTVDLAGEEDDVIALEQEFAGMNDSIEAPAGSTVLLHEGAERDDVVISDEDLVEEGGVHEAIDGGNVTIENTGDFTESVVVFHEFEQRTIAGMVEVLELEGGESTEVALDEYISPWGFFGNTGEEVHQEAVLMDMSLAELDAAESHVTLTGAGILSGEVTDADTGEPVPGAIVEATDGYDTFVTVTDSDGMYELDPQWPGEYSVTVESGAYGPNTETIVMDDELTPMEQDIEAGSDPTFTFEMAAGEAYALGVPGPIEGGTVSDVFAEEPAGAIYLFDADVGEWELVTNPDTDIEPLDALVVVPTEDTQATIELAGTPGDDATGVPGDREVQEGWNFVAPSTHDPADDAFVSTSEPLRVLQMHDEPASAMVPEGGFEGVTTLDEDGHVNPFAGYFVFVEDEGLMSSTLYDGITLTQAYDNLNIDASPVEGTVTSTVTDEGIEMADLVVLDSTGEGYVSWTLSADDGSYAFPALPDDIENLIAADAEGYGAEVTTEESPDISLQDDVHFTVTDFEIDETELEYDDEFTVNATIENEGDETATQWIYLVFGHDVDDFRMDGDTYELHVEQLELEPGENATIEVTDVVGDFVTAGEQEVAVFTGEDDDRITITVSESGSESVDAVAPIGVIAG